jgi:hypothetical protein
MYDGKGEPYLPLGQLERWGFCFLTRTAMQTNCGANKRDGGICHLPAGHQTVHKGVGRCRFHEESDPVFPYKFQSRKLRTSYGMCRDLSELWVFRGLDRSTRVLAYEIEPYKIPYGSGGNHHYIPDILIWYSNGTRKLVEVKSSLSVDVKQVRAKYKLGINFALLNGLQYEVWVCKLKKTGWQKEIFGITELIAEILGAEEWQDAALSAISENTDG